MLKISRSFDPARQVQEKALDRAVGYIRFLKQSLESDFDAQSAAIKKIAAVHTIEILRWKIDETSYKASGGVFRHEVEGLHTYGIGMLIMESFERLHPTKAIQDELIDHASRHGVVVMDGRGMSNWAHYKRKTVEWQVSKLRHEPFRKPKEKFVVDEGKEKLASKIRELRFSGVTLSNMPNALLEAGFASPRGGAWSFAAIANLARLVAPIGKGRRHVWRQK